MKIKTLKALIVSVSLSVVLSLSACGYRPQPQEDIILRESEQQLTEQSEEAETETVTLATSETETETQVMTESTASVLTETENEEQKGGMLVELSEGELGARREQQANFAKVRESLYGLKNSADKTAKINQMDKQILANNAYDFSDKTVVFIGDSITEGITSSIDQNGNYISYVTYVNSYLHFGNVLNHGVGGRMFSAYGGDELSLAMNFENVTNINSDVIVVFAGVNDYLCTPANKHFGSVSDTLTTGNYCGALRYFMKQLKEYYGDREIFFVTMYNINKKSDCEYADFNGQPTLADYMEVEKKLAAEYGFNVIDLYGTGFMDCSTSELSDYYLSDGLHPKDNGSIALGEHIAAELSLYFSQKQK